MYLDTIEVKANRGLDGWTKMQGVLINGTSCLVFRSLGPHLVTHSRTHSSYGRCELLTLAESLAICLLEETVGSPTGCHADGFERR